ncbi:DeoR family transcriptional regulator [Mucilaginibacter rubeus]|uniref:DeoR family transcriptional regulator n=1 Tax=Mucilaginibacter rubeus TaxID=2027860 RepID=A0AAE6JF87_9SPHI|nr:MULTISPECIES: HTH domain-containing protein [Mucilaginibacter]QEM03722.1 DeoR family transcriptional regulator [Mucilaginibacter rubeus]QEM16333.1 DeoR family transcriptional regulator [Mucilaginibacter gossypii]QTE40902.1 DeoR family transcriptional regulator [Mucilaginibacter rubeus]QTE47505.1 DeoR family transcriptional regulator [Mucilaginibacter rubeus]QTE58897.1 DeoR family transcriptional regulator [Mucilaginibacter rubeus]
MDYRTYEKRLEYILELIEKGRFGSIERVAKRFDVSTRTVKRMLQNLRDKGHDILYDKKIKKYYIKNTE